MMHHRGANGRAPMGKGTWRMRWSEKRTRIGLLIALGYAMSHSAAAQVTFGSPADPPRIAIGGGALDVLLHINPANSMTTGLSLGEYRFVDTVWILAPIVVAFDTCPQTCY